MLILSKVYLTPGDTRLMFEDAMLFADWATTVTMSLTGDPCDDTNPCIEWASIVCDTQSPAGPRLITHDVWLDAMRAMVDTRDTIHLNDTIIDQVTAILDAIHYHEASDLVCQMDSIGFDAILQVACFEDVLYG